jgi:hypothetical protein
MLTSRAFWSRCCHRPERPGPKLRLAAPLLRPTARTFSGGPGTPPPFRHLRALKDERERALLRESGNMPGKRRRGAGRQTLPR